MHIKIIAGSTRPGRFNMQPAAWLKALAEKQEGITVSLVDLAEVGLPMYDETVPASMNQYEHEHTKKWAEIIGEADGFIFVTPEYNHSYSAALKNALDYLYAEWNYKPVSFVSYGSGAGGARAVEHLRGIAGELKMYDLREQLVLSNYWERLNDRGEYQFSETEEETAKKILSDLAFWSKQMKGAREELSA